MMGVLYVARNVCLHFKTAPKIPENTIKEVYHVSKRNTRGCDIRIQTRYRSVMVQQQWKAKTCCKSNCNDNDMIKRRYHGSPILIRNSTIPPSTPLSRNTSVYHDLTCAVPLCCGTDGLAFACLGTLGSCIPAVLSGRFPMAFTSHAFSSLN